MDWDQICDIHCRNDMFSVHFYIMSHMLLTIILKYAIIAGYIKY